MNAYTHASRIASIPTWRLGTAYMHAWMCMHPCVHDMDACNHPCFDPFPMQDLATHGRRGYHLVSPPAITLTMQCSAGTLLFWLMTLLSAKRRSRHTKRASRHSPMGRWRYLIPPIRIAHFILPLGSRAWGIYPPLGYCSYLVVDVSWC